MQYGIDIEYLSHDADVPGLFPSVFHATISDKLRQTGQAMFAQRLREIRRNGRLVSRVRDAGTVIHFKVVHATLGHPSRFSKVIPPEPYESHDWNTDKYESFFRKIVTALLPNDGNWPLGICGIICDNLLAQAAGLLHFISDKEGPAAGMMHIHYFNHI
jgi:hypothetical protein